MSDFIIIGDRIERRSNVDSVYIRPVKGSSRFDVVARMISGAEIKHGVCDTKEEARRSLLMTKNLLNL